jgi:hypothetical protein
MFGRANRTVLERTVSKRCVRSCGDPHGYWVSCMSPPPKIGASDHLLIKTSSDACLERLAGATASKWQRLARECAGASRQQAERARAAGSAHADYRQVGDCGKASYGATQQTPARAYGRAGICGFALLWWRGFFSASEHPLWQVRSNQSPQHRRRVSLPAHMKKEASAAA